MTESQEVALPSMELVKYSNIWDSEEEVVNFWR